MLKLGDIVKNKETNKVEGMIITTCGDYTVRLLYKDDVNNLNTKSICYGTKLKNHLEVIDHLDIESPINNYFYNTN